LWHRQRIHRARFQRNAGGESDMGLVAAALAIIGVAIAAQGQERAAMPLRSANVRACYARYRERDSKEKHVSRISLEANPGPQKTVWGMKNEEYMVELRGTYSVRFGHLS
jgi:hypothetical protein